MKKNICIAFLVIVLILIIIVTIISTLKKIIYDINYANKINSIMEDTVEIEKKWLIDKDKIPYDLYNSEIIEIEQTYICFSPEIRVRKINNGKEYTFAVKTNITSDGMIRDEMENSITQEEYSNLMKKQEGNTIYKTRYQFLDGDYLLAIDIFSGELDGLAYLEIEFENQEEANNFQTPNWVIKDVTSDLNYKNGHLARYGIPDSFFEYIK
jgi:CYTH domain-containing protein